MLLSREKSQHPESKNKQPINSAADFITKATQPNEVNMDKQNRMKELNEETARMGRLVIEGEPAGAVEVDSKDVQAAAWRLAEPQPKLVPSARGQVFMPSYLDLGLIGVILVSSLLAMLRGFTREVLAIDRNGTGGRVKETSGQTRDRALSTA